jgi:hypothetical protein
MNPTLLRSAMEWQRLVGRAEAVFDLSLRLPAVVSHLSCGRAPFFDGDVILGEGGWSLVSSLAAFHNDGVVNLLVVDPGPDLYLEWLGRYGGFCCQSNATSDCYTRGLFGDTASPLVGQIAYTAEVVAVFGDSGRWGVWVERNIAGLVTSADPGALPEWELYHGPFLPADEALDDFLGLQLGGSAASSAFGDTLRRNYGVFGTGPLHR